MSSWKEDLNVWPRKLPSVQLDIDKLALIIIDMQLYDTSRNYGLAHSLKNYPSMFNYYYDRIDDIVLPNNVRLLHFFRDNNLPVIHVTVGAELKDGSDQIPRRKRRDNTMTSDTGVNFTFYKGSKPQQIHPDLKPLEGELVLNKNSSSAFNSTAIDQFLRNMRIEGLFMTGVSTSTCVETTARDASDRGYECVLIEDACASFDQYSHDATLKIFARMFGEVWSTEEAIQKTNKLMY
ncbi:isochorismatase family cysteine hydrolase [Virgibacillus sp. C22-A2]|uniref:Isochorismatase family cysteine hydrolase n=1 Tax=Virgibacillus tibetensis TaxID=3042313 RepID=A0ABU6KFZ0_9BACI|nr:isochorismatase family cysteine hydrolase [Virgibacillus sp. C22-A2]